MAATEDEQQAPEGSGSEAPARRFGVLAKLALLLGSLVVVLLLVEVGFRFAGYGPDEHMRWFAHPELHYAPAPNQRGVVKVADKKAGDVEIEIFINSHGQRSEDYALEKEPGEFRVMALGDSLTYGPGVSNEHTFLSVAQADFRAKPPAEGSVRLVNTACNGYSTVHYLRWMETQMDTYDPDLMLVCLFIGNDMCIATRQTLFNPVPWPSVTRNTAFGHYLLENHRPLLTRWAQALAGDDEPTLLEPIPAELRKYLNVPEGKLGYDEKTQLWRHSLGHMERMLEIAKERDTPIACLLIPQSHMVSKDNDFPLLGWLRRAVQRMGIPVIDLVEPLQPLGMEGWHPYDPGHLNVEGHAAVGAALADGLRDLGYGN